MLWNGMRCLSCLLSLAFLSGFVAGCGPKLEGEGQDVDLISEKASKKIEQPKTSGALWPLSSGKIWHTITMRPGQSSQNSEIRVMGAYRLPDGRTGTIVRSYRNGKQFRVEVYQADKAGTLNLLGLGETDEKMLTFNPAVPMLAVPTKEGQGLQWNGSARIDGKNYTATAYHRLSAVETVKTPFDSYRAFRLDGIITLINGQQRIDYPVVMWFVPGKGIAQRRLADKGSLALEVITKFAG